jgi:hypothetical protein
MQRWDSISNILSNNPWCAEGVTKVFIVSVRLCRKSDAYVKIDTSFFDYDVINLSAQEPIYNFYKEKKLFPSKLIASDYYQMLRKSGLLEVIEEVIDQSVQVSPSRLL